MPYPIAMRPQRRKFSQTRSASILEASELTAVRRACVVFESFYARFVLRWPGSIATCGVPALSARERLAANVQFLVLHHSPVRYTPRTGPDVE